MNSSDMSSFGSVVSNATSVCFSRQDFNMYMYLLLMLLGYILYILYKQKESMSNVEMTSHLSVKELRSKIDTLQEQLYTCKLSEQQCKVSLLQSKESVRSDQSVAANLRKLYDPLEAPGRLYVNSRTSAGSENNLIGYVYNNNERYPLFGRFKYPGRSEKWEYYIIDETRNKLKIPFKTQNDNELSDGDTVDIPSVGNMYSVKIYEYDQLKYNPNIL